jgi:hypothetical protein
MAVAIRINPIAPERVDEWRAFVAELTGPRRIEWAESHRRRGITRQVISMAEAAGQPMSVVVVEADDPRVADELLMSSTHGFDVWLRGRLADLLGAPVQVGVMYDSAPRKGPWRGMRRPGRRP